MINNNMFVLYFKFLLYVLCQFHKYYFIFYIDLLFLSIRQSRIHSMVWIFYLLCLVSFLHPIFEVGGKSITYVYINVVFNLELFSGDCHC